MRAAVLPFLASRVIVLVALGAARFSVSHFKLGAVARGPSRSGLLAWEGTAKPVVSFLEGKKHLFIEELHFNNAGRYLCDGSVLRQAVDNLNSLSIEIAAGIQ